MPWFMGAAWIPKFDGDKTKFGEWRGQVEAMLRAQGLNPQQQADFLLGVLEGEATRGCSLWNLKIRILDRKWQKQDLDDTEEGDDLLLDQLMVGLLMGPIKQELSRQIWRDEHMTFTAVCKEVQALEHELQEGEDAILSQRVTAPTPRDNTADLKMLKGQIQVELQQELMGEMREQMKALSSA
ncbi:hypothetical protein SRHO_G00097810 [Serrasalmus rhombeus]